MKAGTTAHVAVVGGGIAGLAAAERLARDGMRVTLFEASDRLGGTIRTERRDGFVIEHGPDALLAAKPAASAFCERLGISDRLHGTTPGAGAFVLRGEELKRLPAGMSGLVPARIGPLFTSGILSPGGIVRAAMEPMIPRRRDEADESVASFVRRRFGQEVLARLVEPLLAGIYAGDAEQLSILATFPQLRSAEREHGSVLRAIRNAPPKPAGGTSAFLSLPSGLAEIVEAAERCFRAGDAVEIRMSTAVSGVMRHLGGAVALTLARGGAVTCDAVVVATPAHVAATILRNADEKLAAELSAIEHASVATISVGYKAAAIARVLDGTGYVIPRAERQPILACTWTSAKWPGRAPPGHALFRIFVGGAGRDEVLNATDDNLINLACSELATRVGARGEPVLTAVSRWRNATPQYRLGHAARIARIDQRVAAMPGITLAGNAYGGVGISDCVRSGERAAEQVLKTCAQADAKEPG